MNYCYVENNTIVEGPRGLPRSWRNISGLDMMDADGLRAIGWFPVRLDEGIVDEKFVGSMFIIHTNEVVEMKLWSKYTADEKAEMDRQAASAIRAERNTKLTECDWTQLNDTPLDNPSKVAWTTWDDLAVESRNLNEPQQPR